MKNQPYYVEQDPAPNGQLPFSFHVQTLLHGQMAQPHVHGWIEMLYGLEGEQRVRVNNTEYVFRQGDLVLINAHALHSVDGIAQDGNRYAVIKFNPDLLHSAVPTATEFKYLLPFTLQDSETPKYFAAAELRESPVPELIRTILHEEEQRLFGYELALRLSVDQLFLWILRYWNACGIHVLYEPNPSTAHLQPAFDYVYAHFGETIEVSAMAQLCRMSYSAFSRSFHRIAGRSFVQYLRYVRLLQAKMLLSKTELPVTDIALQTGFYTSSYFIEQFRRSEGISPLQYRILLRGQKIRP